MAQSWKSLPVAALVVAAMTGAAAPVGPHIPAYSWSPAAAVPTGTTEAQSVVVGEKLYLFGGFDVRKGCCTPTTRAWVFDDGSGAWTALPTMPAGISHAGIDTDGTRYVYWAGGYPADPSGTNQLFGTTDAWRYDVQTATYSRLPSLPAARAAGGLAYLDGGLYYFGGSNLARTVDSPDVWELDVAHGATAWVSRAAMPGPRNHLGWGVIGGALYAVGGQHFSDSTTAQAELDRYDPGTDRWTRLADLPGARSHLMDSTFVVDGQLVTAGGWTSKAVSAQVTAYDPGTDTWRAWPPLPEARTSTTVKLVGRRILFCCGSAGTSSSTAWLSSAVAAPAPPTTPTPPVQPAPTPPPTPPPSPPAPVVPRPLPTLAVSHVAVHPSTVTAGRAGHAVGWFRLNHRGTVALALVRCRAGRCTHVVARRTFVSPGGVSHVSLHAVTRRWRLSPGHYRLVVAPAGGRSTSLRIVVRAS